VRSPYRPLLLVAKKMPFEAAWILLLVDAFFTPTLLVVRALQNIKKQFSAKNINVKETAKNTNGKETSDFHRRYIMFKTVFFFLSTYISFMYKRQLAGHDFVMSYLWYTTPGILTFVAVYYTLLNFMYGVKWTDSNSKICLKYLRDVFFFICLLGLYLDWEPLATLQVANYVAQLVAFGCELMNPSHLKHELIDSTYNLLAISVGHGLFLIDLLLLTDETTERYLCTHGLFNTFYKSCNAVSFALFNIYISPFPNKRMLVVIPWVSADMATIGLLARDCNWDPQHELYVGYSFGVAAGGVLQFWVFFLVPIIIMHHRQRHLVESVV